MTKETEYKVKLGVLAVGLAVGLSYVMAYWDEVWQGGNAGQVDEQSGLVACPPGYADVKSAMETARFANVGVSKTGEVCAIR